MGIAVKRKKNKGFCRNHENGYRRSYKAARKSDGYRCYEAGSQENAGSAEIGLK